MTAELQPKLFKRGDTYTEVFTMKDGDNQPLNLSIYTNVKMDIRSGNNRYSTLLYSVELLSGITISGDDNNIITIEIDKEITDEWIEGSYNRDIAFFTNSKKETLLEGKIIVKENITI